MVPKHSHRLRSMGTKRPRPAEVTGQLHTLNYDYTLNPADSVCTESVYLLVMVESTTYNAFERDYFRSRWKVSEYDNKKVATVFVTGRCAMVYDPYDQ